jgi:hypothetical protein
MLFIVDLETVSNPEFIGIDTLYVRTIIEVCNSSGSLVIAMIPKVKYRFYAAAILLSYVLPPPPNKMEKGKKRKNLIRCLFFKGRLPCVISGLY